MGLLAGLTTDIVLRARSRALRFVVAMAMLLAWMGAGTLSAILAGVDPLHVIAGAGYWLEVGQVAIGGLSVVVALLVCQAARRNQPSPVKDVTWVWEAGRRNSRPWKASLLRRGLVPGLILATLLGLGLGTLQAYAYLLPAAIPTLALALAGAGLVGLLVGGWCRLALQGRAQVLRFAVALVVLLAGAVVSQGVYAFLRGLNPLLRYTASEALWTVLGQLAVGGLCLVVASLVWQQEPAPPPVPRRTPAPAPVSRQPTVAPQPRPSVRVQRGPRFRLPPLRLPVHFRGRKHLKARVITAEQDRCPYCLDVVTPDDPHGMVVCEICGTPHHADCWEAAGGKCQVPHLNV